MRYRHRRNRWGWRGFPLFFILFFIGGHSWASFLISVGLVVLLFLLVRWLLASTSRSGISGAPPMANQPYQQPYQQQGSSPYYEPPYQPYQPYQQGYQTPQGGYEQSGQESQYPEQRPEYEQYEQPHAQYPQEMPPMK